MTPANSRATDVQSQRPREHSDHPNIVIIVADDLGFSDLGCYGSEISTPTIDGLARNGLCFSQMYSAARCCPSRAALLTGLYPHQTGIGHMTVPLKLDSPAYQGHLNDHCVTIAEPLRAAGYRTLMSGKWHVAKLRSDRDDWPEERLAYPLPRERGFDEFFGTLHGAGSYFNPRNLMHNETILRNEDPDWYFTDAISDHAIEMVSRAITDEVPFFLYLAYTAPHWPLQAIEDDIARYERAYVHGWDAIRTARHEQLRGLGLIDDRWPISPRDPDAWSWYETAYPEWEANRMAVYAAQVDRMDQGVGRLVEMLRAGNQFENTLIFVLSDNGGCAEWLAEDGILDLRLMAQSTPDGRPVRVGNRPDLLPGAADTFQSYDICWANVSNAPFRRFKHWVHEGGISTPLVVHWPNRIRSAGLRHTPAHLIDLMPTCIEVAGARYPAVFNAHSIQPMEGHSLVPSFERSGWERPRSLYFEHEGNRAVRRGVWKLVSAYPGKWELYNVDEDRTELNDLADHEKARVNRMAGKWLRWAERVGVSESFRDDYAQTFARDTTLTGRGREGLLRT